jgi:DNA repair protein RadD
MAERDELIQGLATGEIEVLAACDLISEGLDVSAISAVILLRPTKSLALAMQQIGRGMRPAEGTESLTPFLEYRHGRSLCFDAPARIDPS